VWKERDARVNEIYDALPHAHWILGFAAFLTCAAFLFESTLVASPVLKAVLIAMALASADLALGACWAVPIDIAPDHAGVITGFMNTLGNIGGLIGPLVVGLAVDRWHSWTFPFYITALVYTGGALAWLAIDPTTPIARRTRAPTP
jgi:nitrate/nitrite transporter NarK